MSHIPGIFVVDGHSDTLWAAPREGRDWTKRSQVGQADLPRMREGGVNLQVLALFSDPAHKGTGYAVAALEMIDRFHTGLTDWHRAKSDAKEDSASSDIHIVTKASHIDLIGEGLGFLLSIEGGEALGGSLGALRTFHRLGVRALGLVWNHRNELADGVADADSGGGLTPFGRQVVSEMESLGMVVDVSHLSESGFWDVVRHATKPFIASHSNARALCDHPRNLTDRQIKAIADADGVIGVNFAPQFLSVRDRATLDDVVAHINHIVDVAGVRHVGIGSDFDGILQTPQGLEDATTYPVLIRALYDRGFSEDAVQAIMGGNFVRLFKQILP